MLVMGYMSGTSLDGVDVAMIETDGESSRVSARPAGALHRCGARGGAGADALDWDGMGRSLPASRRRAA
jgi:anhydro-N-acetylmuramic acid kinase